MTSRSGLWTRRAFTQSAAVSTAVATLLPSRLVLAESARKLPTHAYVASCPGGRDAPGAIHTFSLSCGVWTRRQVLACVAPSHLEPHPTLPVLYAVHDVAQWDHRPRGAVSAFAIDRSSGRLTRMTTQPLALSATYPKHAVVSGDGQDLVVAAQGGGAYNVLPLTAEGLPGAPRLIRKEVGRAHAGPAEPARPTWIMRHPQTDCLITADAGNQTISTFALAEDSMPALGRLHLGAGMELAGMELVDAALSACGRWAFVLHAGGAISTYAVDGSGVLGPRASGVGGQPSESGRMVVHPDGRALITTGTYEQTTLLRVWQVEARSGVLSLTHAVKLVGALGWIAFAPDGDGLLATGWGSAAIVGIPLEGHSLRPGAPRVLAQVGGATGIALRVV